MRSISAANTSDDARWAPVTVTGDQIAWRFDTHVAGALARFTLLSLPCLFWARRGAR